MPEQKIPYGYERRVYNLDTGRHTKLAGEELDSIVKEEREAINKAGDIVKKILPNVEVLVNEVGEGTFYLKDENDKDLYVFVSTNKGIIGEKIGRNTNSQMVN